MNNCKKFAKAHKNYAFSHSLKSAFRLVGERSPICQPALADRSLLKVLETKLFYLYSNSQPQTTQGKSGCLTLT